MKKAVKRIISSVLVCAAVATSSICTAVTAFADEVYVTYGDIDGEDGITKDDANAALEYVQYRKGLTKLSRAAAALGYTAKAITATNAAMIFRKAVDPAFNFPNGDGDLVDISGDEPTTVFVLGDSTGASFGDPTYFYKRVGFGVPLGEYFNENVTVRNLALSGRSSKSYVADPEYATFKSDIKENDFVIIAFGHNDEKTEEARYTNPNGDKDTAGSFQNSLYVNYVKPALDKGATPILATPIVRRSASGVYSGSSIHVTSDKEGYPGGDYAQAVRNLGKDLGLTVVDNTAMTKELYESLTPTETLYFHAWEGNKEVNVDNTHINNYGAHYVDYMMAKALEESDNELGNYVKEGIEVPTKEKYLQENPDYVPLSDEDKTDEDLAKSKWKTTAPWFGSVFGSVGGEPNTTNFNIAESGNTVTIRAGIPSSNTAKGKLSGGETGVAFYFQNINAGSDFQISGKITVTDVNAETAPNPNQISFGAAIFDTVEVDTSIKTPYNIVGAGPVGIIAGSPVTFTQNATTAKIASSSNATLAEPIKKGDTFDVSIVKDGNTVTAKFGDTEQVYTVNGDDGIPMTGNAYIGFYASRCIEISVSDIAYNNEVVKK